MENEIPIEQDGIKKSMDLNDCISELKEEIPIQEASDDKGDETLSRLEQAEMKAVEYLDHLQRIQAEFSNYRKRMDKEKQSLRDWLHGQMVLEMLPILDDLDRLLRSHDSQNQCDIEGVKMIQQKLQKTLKNKGLQEIESVGQAFNPDLHEAVSVEHTQEDQAGQVLEEWEKGYKLGDKLLRPSRVKVGQTKVKAGDDSQ